MEIIPSKIALTLTHSDWKWLHEESWNDQHREFASKCGCFSNIGAHRSTWLSPGGQGKPQASITGFVRVGRWVLEESNTGKLLSALQLQWEDGTFDTAWIAVSTPEESTLRTDEEHPLNWMIEAVIRRLSPDQVTISGDIPKHIVSSFDAGRCLTPKGHNSINILDNQLMTITEIVRLTKESWDQCSTTKKARGDLSWVQKRVDRERRELEKNSNPRKKPFLLRLLIAMSPMRRMNRSKMVHPLTKYRARL